MQPTVSVQKLAWACVVPFPLTGTSAPLEPAGDVVMGRKPEECCAAPSAAAGAYSTVPAQVAHQGRMSCAQGMHGRQRRRWEIRQRVQYLTKKRGIAAAITR